MSAVFDIGMVSKSSIEPVRYVEQLPFCRQDIHVLWKHKLKGVFWLTQLESLTE